MPTVRFEQLWIEGAWHAEVDVTIEAGRVRHWAEAPAGSTLPGERIAGLTLPGLPDAHCHAFQRVLAPWTQRARARHEDFWSWREAMYTVAAHCGPEELEAIAARCYLELLHGGYTRVAEFLYLHRLRGVHGPLDADQAIVAAARTSGIGLTLLPALYQRAGFGVNDASAGQRAFVRSTAQFRDDWRRLRERYPDSESLTLGAAFHSLRAVDIDTMAALAAELLAAGHCAVLHVHVAEQPAEVAACLQQHGAGPVALLAARGLLGPRWALIHALHLSAQERAQLAASGATVVACPSTEADLGDGVGALAAYLDRGGSLALGSDSNIERCACAELRLLEWGLRLQSGRRNVLATPTHPSVADRLFAAVLAGGRRALGDEGATVPADFVSYDEQAADWRALPPECYLSALVFDAGAPRAREVMVGGQRVIRAGHHAQERQIEARYQMALRQLRPSLQHALLETPAT